MKKHKWKEFATILGFPYNKRFTTDGYGDWRIDNKGIYSYEEKAYTSDNNCWDYIYLFLDGEINLGVD